MSIVVWMCGPHIKRPPPAGGKQSDAASTSSGRTHPGSTHPLHGGQRLAGIISRIELCVIVQGVKRAEAPYQRHKVGTKQRLAAQRSTHKQLCLPSDLRALSLERKQAHNNNKLESTPSQSKWCGVTSRVTTQTIAKEPQIEVLNTATSKSLDPATAALRE